MSMILTSDDFLRLFLNYIKENWEVSLEIRSLLFDSGLIVIDQFGVKVESDRNKIEIYSNIVSEYIEKVFILDSNFNAGDSFFVDLHAICMDSLLASSDSQSQEEALRAGREAGTIHVSTLQWVRKDLRRYPTLRKINSLTGPFGFISNAMGDLTVNLSRKELRNTCKRWMDLPHWQQPLLAFMMISSNPSAINYPAFENYIQSFKYYESRIRNING